MQYIRGILEVYLSSVIADTVYSEYTGSILLYHFDVGVLFFLLQYEISILQIYYSTITDSALFKVLFFLSFAVGNKYTSIYRSSINDH